MKIAMLSDARNVHSLRTLEYFIGQGDEARLFTCEPPETDRDEIVHLEGVSVGTLLNCTMTLPALRRAVETFGPDVVNGYGLADYGWLAGRIGVAPLALTLSRADLPRDGSGRLFNRWRARRVLRSADLVVATSFGVGERIRDMSENGVHLCQAAGGVDRAFHAAGAARAARPKVILHDHPLELKYGVLDVLSGLAGFLQVFPDWRLLMIGDGPDRDAVVAEAARLGLSDGIDWLTPASEEELGWIADRAQIFVSAAGDDADAESLLRAMSRGVYPVVADSGFAREWLPDEPRGMLFEPGGSSDIARALLKAVALPLDTRREALEANRDAVAERGIRQDNLSRVRQALCELTEGSA